MVALLLTAGVTWLAFRRPEGGADTLTGGASIGKSARGTSLRRLSPASAVSFGRIGPMTWLDDHRLAVVDEADQRIHVIDIRDDRLESFGRAGDGPGEFRRISGLAQYGDEVLVFESAPGPSRVHRRDSQRVVRREDLRGDQGRLRGVGVLRGGSLVVTQDGFRPVVPPAPGKTRRDTLVVGIRNSAGEVLWLPPILGRTWLGYRSASSGGQTLMTSIPFAPTGAIVATGDAVWLCDSGTGDCHVYSERGESRGTVRLQSSPQRLTSGLLDVVRERLQPASRDEFLLEQHAVQTDPSVQPEWLPVFETVFGGHRPGLWAVRTRAATGGRDLVQFDEAGQLVSATALPPGFRVGAIGVSGVAGIEVDSDGAEHVAVLPWSSQPR